MPLLVESAASDFPQELFANISGQLRLRGRDIRNRLVDSFVCRGCQEGVDGSSGYHKVVDVPILRPLGKQIAHASSSWR